MRELRWLLRLAPPFAALSAVIALGSASLRASAVVAPAGCAGPQTLASASTQAAGGAPGFVISPLLDGGGTLAGQRVEIGPAASAPLRLELPPESFAAGPFGRAILVGADDGRRSALRGFDATSGCAWPLATETDVIRRATMDASTGNVYEFRVDRGTRADLGVWRRPLAGGPPTQVLAPLPPDDRYGPTFSTELSWSAEGDVLVAQSCGMRICRTRLLDIAGGTVRSIETADQGEVIGLARGRLITYSACRGLPCPIASIDTTTREVTKVVPAAGAGRMVATTAGEQVLAEVGADDERALVLVDPATATSVAVPANVRGWHLVPSASRADGALDAPPGWALLTRDGRAPGPGDPAELINVDDGATLNLTEVTR
jgi:hypothetical protein